MSLFALPVTLTDIENLQQGIEFQTNPAQAAVLEGQINAGTSTVFAAAQQMLLAMEPLSWVVMAVDSLMSDAVQSEAEMTNLTVNFLPAQLSYKETAIGIGVSSAAKPRSAKRLSKRFVCCCFERRLK